MTLLSRDMMLTRTPPGPGARLRSVVPLLLGLLALALVAALVVSGTAGAPPAARPATHPQRISVAAAATKPNVVMVMADDMRTDDLRFMPHVRREIVGHGL